MMEVHTDSNNINYSCPLHFDNGEVRLSKVLTGRDTVLQTLKNTKKKHPQKRDTVLRKRQETGDYVFEQPYETNSTHCLDLAFQVPTRDFSTILRCRQ